MSSQMFGIVVLNEIHVGAGLGRFETCPYCPYQFQYATGRRCGEGIGPT